MVMGITKTIKGDLKSPMLIMCGILSQTIKDNFSSIAITVLEVMYLI